ncbi:MAG: hypothetical protein HY367_03935 [Candidatus Aenigmarchaeota archaeon]|nr:hypothetical protein [Candidatus Aenigmarchaeota archaeon]
MALADAAYSLLANTPVLPAVTQIIIFGLTALIFKQKRKADFTNSLHFLLIGFSFFALGFVNLMVSFGLQARFLYEISVFQTLFWSVALTVIISVISGLKKLKYALVVITLSIAIVLAVSPSKILLLTNFISYYLAAISFFVLFAFSQRPIKNAGLYGMIMVFVSTLFTVAGVDPSSYVWFVPNLLLAISLTYFVRFGLLFDHFVRPTKLELIERDTGGRPVNIWKPIMYLLTYIVLLNTVLFISSISLHELGHLAVGNLLGCESGKIVLVDLDLFEQSTIGPYTEISCPPSVELIYLGLSGHAFIVPFGLAFLLLRRFPEKNFAYVIIGLALMLGGLDMFLVFRDQLFIPFISLIPGIALFCLGEIWLINDYVTFSRQHAHRRRRSAPARQEEEPEGKDSLEINLGEE